MNRTKTRGKFIILEGGEGTGKGTCKNYLQQKLLGQPVIFTYEPGGTEVGDEIRETLLKHRKMDVSPLTELLLFAASRAQHLEEKIFPAIEAGISVISDRFAASSFAYQVRASERPEFLKLFQVIHEPLFERLKPDLYIVLDLDPKIGQERARQRGLQNRLDIKPLDYHERVRSGLLEHAKLWPHQIIDASQDLEQVQSAVWQAVAKKLRIKNI